MLDTVASFVEGIIAKHRQRTKVEAVNHLGHSFEIDPEVFSPFIAPSGYLSFSLAAQPIFREARVLDIGCGAGIFASLAALSGATSVVAIDINPIAIQNARRNARSLGVASRIDLRCGDLFGPVSQNESFDLVFADLPFTSGNATDWLARAFYDPDLDTIRRFLHDIKHILLRSRRDARAFLCLSDFETLTPSDFSELSSLDISTHLTVNLPQVELRLYQLKLRS